MGDENKKTEEKPDDQPAVASSQPAVASSQPAVASSQPAVASSQPAVTSSQPAVASSQPAVTSSQPAVTSSQPAVASSQPAVTSSEQQTTNSEQPATDQPAVTSNEQRTTGNEQPQDMEVHHHSHAHGKRNWKSYFWEFLMLFLAVFCGFLAEYLLEHKIEKERGKQFIESFYEDLRTDTARITFYTTFDDEKIKSLVNLENCYDAVLKNMNDAGCLMEVIKHTAINRPFMRTDRTLKQLANAGGFRLLKKEDADSILSYDVAFNNFQDFQSTIFQEAQDNVRNTFNALGNFRANAQMFRPVEGKIISTGSFIKEDVTAPLLFSGDKNVLNKYFNELQLYYRVTYNHKKMLLGLKDKQAQLIEHLKNKYHFD